MIKAILFVAILLPFKQAWTQSQSATILQGTSDSVNWISVKTDSGTVHAAVAVPKGKGPFPAIIILHGTHGFAEEYIFNWPVISHRTDLWVSPPAGLPVERE
jgi:hypothetical protein